MISTRWLEKRREHWNRLESMLAQTRKDGMRALTRNELRELGLLYRQTASDLSVLREDPGNGNLERYLNQLLARAHNTIYGGRKASALGIVHFYRETYPRIFRETFRFTFIAFALFMLSGVVGAILTVLRPEFMHQILGPHMVETIERHKMWTESVLTMKPVASSGIMTNNMTVSFMAFATGIIAGLGTIYMMIMNGLLIGVVGAACWMHDMSVPLWSFVAPHGVLELPAIFIAGGAGLFLGHGLLFPGVLSRRDSVAQAGAVAVRLVLGIIPLLVIAGFIEGFLSPSHLPVPLKFAFAAVMATLLVLYLSSKRNTAADHADGAPNLKNASERDHRRAMAGHPEV